MTTRTKFLALAGAAVAVVAASWAGFLLVNLHGAGPKGPAVLLEPGWQFYAKPTMLEPPGTIFRIDKKGRKYLVDSLAVVPVNGPEAVGRTEMIAEVSGNLLARIVGMGSQGEITSEGRKTERIHFAMMGTQREVITDKMVEELLREFASKGRYKKDNRYFVIMEARSATEIHYVLTEGLVDNLGGEASLKKNLEGRGLLCVKKAREYDLSETFEKPMRVMFLVEEIVVSGSSLSGMPPDFDTVPVREGLSWTE
jgi:hypothetical protein